MIYKLRVGNVMLRAGDIDAARVQVLDPRGHVCGVIEATADGVRIRGAQMAVTLAHGDEDGCKILLTEPEPET